MKVIELIEELKKFPMTAEVSVEVPSVPDHIKPTMEEVPVDRVVPIACNQFRLVIKP